MSGLYVEGWAPEYGAPLDISDERMAASPIDPSVEDGQWSARPGVDDGVETVVFVDGVRRVEARLTFDDLADGIVPGIVGAFAVGATVWDRTVPRSTVEDVRIERLAILGGGKKPELPPVPGLSIAAESIASDDAGQLIPHLLRRMREAEAALSSRLAASGTFVIADGRIDELGARPIVGFIKTHRVSYLGPERQALVGRLKAGERTPIFLIEAQFPRYSWYLRLDDIRDPHSWSAIARCETPSAIGTDEAVVLADRTAALLPQVASKAHIDPRAPQNLVPIGGLERVLRHRLGDQALVYRALREAVGSERRAKEVSG